MVEVKQAIVVEGRYDKNTLSQIVDCPIFETEGFGVMKNEALLALLRTAAQTRGLVILTDSDGAGLVIRNFLKSRLPKAGVLHAYVPEIAGKERRKASPGKAGILGVEGMSREVILQALRDAGAQVGGVTNSSDGGLSRTDLYVLGLSGGKDSRTRRQALLRQLGLPHELGANAFLQALNLLFTKEEFYARMGKTEDTV